MQQRGRPRSPSGLRFSSSVTRTRLGTLAKELAAVQTYLTFLLTESPSAATSDRCGWFPGWRRTDPLTFCRPDGLTDGCCVVRRRPRTAGVT
jgi:hypothetical protein